MGRFNVENYLKEWIAGLAVYKFYLKIIKPPVGESEAFTAMA
jgi:hypothetical protein